MEFIHNCNGINFLYLSFWIIAILKGIFKNFASTFQSFSSLHVVLLVKETLFLISAQKWSKNRKNFVILNPVGQLDFEKKRYIIFFIYQNHYKTRKINPHIITREQISLGGSQMKIFGKVYSNIFESWSLWSWKEELFSMFWFNCCVFLFFFGSLAQVIPAKSFKEHYLKLEAAILFL